MSPTSTGSRTARIFLIGKPSVLVLVLATASVGYSKDAVVPERLPLERYQRLKSDPPFAVKTINVPDPAPKISWAESFYLSGASKFMVNGKERDWVYIVHKSDPAAAFQLYGTEPNELGIQIVKLDWHPENPVNTRVILKKGTESATLDRDRAAFTAPPSAAPKPPDGRVIGTPLMPGGKARGQYIPKR
jgi:hypothetical protein